METVTRQLKLVVHGRKAGYLFLLVVLCLLGLNWLQPHTVCACSCLPIGSPEEELEKADAVFVGTVTDLFSLPGGTDVVYFHVHQAWKGVSRTSAVLITTSAWPGGCGYWFSDDTYLVYAFREGAVLFTDLCSRTHHLSQASEDLEYLRSRPDIALAAAVPPLIPILSLVLAGQVGVVGAIWWWRRRSQLGGNAQGASAVLGAWRGAVIGAGATLTLSGITLANLVLSSVSLTEEEMVVTLIHGLVSGAVMGAVLGILVRSSPVQSSGGRAVVVLAAVSGLFIGPVVLMLVSSIVTFASFALLRTPDVPMVFAGTGGCLCGPVIGAVTGALIAALVARQPAS